MIARKILFLFTIVFGMLSILPAFAEVLVENPNPELIISIGGDNVVNGIGKFIEYFVGVASVIGVVAITWGGIQMMTTAGDEEKMKKARWIMQYALIGTAISAASYGIISFITNIKV